MKRSLRGWLSAGMLVALAAGCDPAFEGEPLPPGAVECEPLCHADELCVDGACITGVDEEDRIIDELDWFDAVELAVLDPHRLTARAVGYLSTVRADGFYRCTAWLVGRDLVLTNDHCLDHALEPDTRVVFDYRRAQDYSSLDRLRAAGFHCNDLAYSAPEFDLALLRCAPHPVSGRLPAEVVGSTLRIDARPPVVGESIYLAHNNCVYDRDRGEHCSFVGPPGPAVEKISLGEVLELDDMPYMLTDREIAAGDSFRHTGDTLGGTSGAPVLDASHRVIGLHHSSNRNGFNRALRFDRIFAEHAALRALLADEYQHRPAPGDLVRTMDADEHHYLQSADGALHRLAVPTDDIFLSLGWWYDDAIIVDPAVLGVIPAGPPVGSDGSAVRRGDVLWRVAGHQRRLFIGDWSADELRAELGSSPELAFERPTDAFLALYPVRPGASGLWPPVRSVVGIAPAVDVVVPPDDVRFRIAPVEHAHRFGLEICRTRLGDDCVHDGSGPYPLIELPVGVREYIVSLPAGDWFWRAAAIGDDSRASNVQWVRGAFEGFRVGAPACVDEDGDGYGEGCEPGADCNDAAFMINPGAVDRCGNGIDEDCSGADRGSCEPGAQQACGVGGIRQCDALCSWGPCEGQQCVGPAVEACGMCGTRQRDCENGAWSPWGACVGEGACVPDARQACGVGGARTCTAACVWGPCEGQQCVGDAVEPCGACGSRRRICSDGVWSPWSPCLGEGPCEPGVEQACDFDRVRTCEFDCQWGGCEVSAELRCPPNSPDCATLVQPQAGVLSFDGGRYRLNDGTPFGEVAVENGGRTNLCIVTWAADEPRLHDVLTPIDDRDGDGWLEWAIPPVRPGFAPYVGCADCAETGLPLQWNFRRCDRDQVGDYADLSTINDATGRPFVYIGPDNFCRDRYGLSVSYDEVRGYYPSGELLMQRACDSPPGPRACDSFVVELWPAAGRRLSGRIDWYDANGALQTRTWVLPDGGGHTAPGDLCRATVDGVGDIDFAHARAWGEAFAAQPLCPLPEGGTGARDDGVCAP